MIDYLYKYLGMQIGCDNMIRTEKYSYREDGCVHTVMERKNDKC